jgi:hypothetical protein
MLNIILQSGTAKLISQTKLYRLTCINYDVSNHVTFKTPHFFLGSVFEHMSFMFFPQSMVSLFTPALNMWPNYIFHTQSSASAINLGTG